MEYDNPVFYKHHKAPFTWTTMKWHRTTSQLVQWCLVSGNLARDLGWKRGKFHLTMGPLRFRVAFYNVDEDELHCERASGELEESIRGALFRVKELVMSPFYYYFWKKNYGG